MGDRRYFIRLLAACAAVAHPRARAQSGMRVYRIGFLTLGNAGPELPSIEPTLTSLREHGFEEGRNLAIVRAYADRLDNLPDAAASLVRQSIDVLVAPTNPAVAAARRATRSVPVVMVVSVDPVGHGFVQSLARPGGNVTGLCLDVSAELLGKYLGYLAAMAPGMKRVGVIRQPASGWSYTTLKNAAVKLGLALEAVDIASLPELDKAFARLTERGVGGLAFFGGGLIYLGRKRIAELAIKHELPAIHAFREYAEAGLLMTYGPSLHDIQTRAGVYIARILRGAKPAEMPIEQPSKFELVVNLRTARTLGLTIPESVRARMTDAIS